MRITDATELPDSAPVGGRAPTERFAPTGRVAPDGRHARVETEGAAPAIVVRDLRMRYGSREVLRGIDLTVRQGELLAFLGPNGAGKTTTVEILEGFRHRRGGEVRVLGVDPEDASPAWRERVGVVLQSCEPEPDLNVRETVELYAGFYAKPRAVDEVLALTGLEGEASTRNQRLSGGQRRRLDVALALVGDPDLLFLDEPTTGFDPAARRAAWGVIGGLRDLGKTIFLTTHYLEEAEALADRIAVITAGRIVAEGTPADLGGRDRLPTTIRFLPVPPIALPDLPPQLEALAQLESDGRIRIECADPLERLRELTTWVTERGYRVERLEVRPPSLEDTYLSLTDGAFEQ